MFCRLFILLLIIIAVENDATANTGQNNYRHSFDSGQRLILAQMSITNIDDDKSLVKSEELAKSNFVLKLILIAISCLFIVSTLLIRSILQKVTIEKKILQMALKAKLNQSAGRDAGKLKVVRINRATTNNDFKELTKLPTLKID